MIRQSAPLQAAMVAYSCVGVSRVTIRWQLARMDRAVDVQVARLRRKLGPAGRRIEAVWGVGYRFHLGSP